MEQIPEILQELQVHFFESTAHWGPRVGETGLFAVSNYMFFLFIALAVTLTFWIVASRQAAAVTSKGDVAPLDLVPHGIGNLAEAAVEFVRNSICIDVMGKEGAKYFPFVGTVFFFILFSNFIGLIPGAKAGTGTMGTTVTWALMVFVVFTWVNISKNGFLGFLKSFIPSGVPKAMAPIMFVLEFLSYLIRPVTLSVRLFANLYAGHVVLGVFALFTAVLIKQASITSSIAIVTILLNIIMYAFEVFVAFIQAYVFAILTAVYIGAALHAADH